MVTIILSLSCRKRILATGGKSLFRINEPSSKETSRLSSDISGILSTRSSAALACKKPPQVGSSSSVFVDDSDHSDSIIHVTPMSSRNGTTAQLDNEECDSPPHTVNHTNLNYSKNTSTDLEESDLFFSPKRKETVLENVSRTSATDNIEQDDFYIDDFDIDDLDDSDIPNYFEEPPSSSVTSQTQSTLNKTIKEGGPSKSQWEKKPTTPPSAPKPSKICSPGKHSKNMVLYDREPRWYL